MADETNENKSSDRAAYAVFLVFAATAATAFAIQAWMTFGFGDEVWKIPGPLAVALIVALDLFAIMFMVLSYLLRGTGWPRFVASSVFVFAIGAQVAAAEMFGEHKKWSTEIRIFAALPAVLLALSQEGVILWRTHRSDPGRQERKEQREQKTGQNTPPPRTPKTQPVTGIEQAPKVQRPPWPATPPNPPPVSSGKTPATAGRGRRTDPAEQARRDAYAAEVIRLGADKQAKEKIAQQAGVSTRAVEMWVASHRERYPDGQPAAPETQPGNTVNTQLTKGVNTDGA